MKKLALLFTLLCTFIFGATIDELNKSVVDNYNNKNFNQVKKDSKDLLDLDENSFVGHKYLGLYYFEDKDYKKSYKELEKAMNINNSDEEVLNKLIDAYYKEHKESDAINIAKRLVELNPNDSDKMVLLSQVYFDNRKIEESVNACFKAIEMNPKNAKAYNWRGNIFVKIYQFSVAIDDYTKAIELDPTNPVYYKNRGLAKGCLKDKDGMNADYKIAKELENQKK